MKTNSNISIFNNDNFGDLRVVMKDGEPWFVAHDVASALGYAKPRNAISTHCKKTVAAPKQGGGFMGIIPESDVYRLVMRSKLPEAEAFQDWVVEEVLPSIRKQGAYVHAREGDTEVEILARGMLAAKSAIDRLESRVAELAPAAEKYDRYLDVGLNESIGTLAKIAQDSGIDVGVTELFEVFRFKHVLCSGKGINWNQPYANYARAGLVTSPMPITPGPGW